MAQKAVQSMCSLAANNSESGWVTKPVIARHCSLSLRSIDNAVARRMIPFAKFGKAIRFRIADVDRALERFVRRETR